MDINDYLLIGAVQFAFYIEKFFGYFWMKGEMSRIEENTKSNHGMKRRKERILGLTKIGFLLPTPLDSVYTIRGAIKLYDDEMRIENESLTKNSNESYFDKPYNKKRRKLEFVTETDFLLGQPYYKNERILDFVDNGN